MTIKQFIKKYIPKDSRLEAEEILDRMVADACVAAYLEAVSGARSHLRGVVTEMGQW